MEVMLPSPACGDFNFDSTCTSPYVSTPSSPQHDHGNYYFSAPSSPTRATAFIRQISFAFPTTCNSPAPQNPSNFSENPENPEETLTLCCEEDESEDFAFNFSGQLELSPHIPADELFDGGKIKPLESPPRLPTRMLKSALSFRHRKKCPEPRTNIVTGNTFKEERSPRGRTRNYDSYNSVRRHGARSLSPLKFSSDNLVSERTNTKENAKEASLNSSSVSSSSWYEKWKLTDYLLFRSASDGHGSNKKYDVFNENRGENVKNSSSRSKYGSGSGSSSGRRKKEGLRGYESDYKVNPTASGELTRRKTFLPYKQNLMGCMDLNSGIHEPCRRIGSQMMRQ